MAQQRVENDSNNFLSLQVDAGLGGSSTSKWQQIFQVSGVEAGIAVKRVSRAPTD